MKYIILLFCFIISLSVKSQSADCISKFDRAVKVINGFNNCSQKQEVQNAFNIDLVYVINNCPSYYAQNQDKVNQAKAKAEKIALSLNCNNSNSSKQNSSSTCSTSNQTIQQPNSVISQFKEKPIEYSNNKTKDGTKLKDEEKKLLENIESATNIGEFDESKINEILGIKEDNIKVAQEAYHIESRGRSPFFNIVVFSGYKAKFDGILDIDVSIDENGKLTSVSTASKPKDEELNRLVTNYIFEKYSKNREWSPAVGTNGRYISSNLNYKENFHRIIETAKVEQKQKPVENDKIDNQESENNQSYYQKFIDFKNGLINNTKSSKSEGINNNDKSLEITESMENDAKLGLLQLLSKPKVSIIEVRSYILSNIAKVNIGLKKIWQDAFNEMERMETENK